MTNTLEIMFSKLLKEYKMEIEQSEVFKKELDKQIKLFNQIYNTFGFDFGTKLEYLIINLDNILVKQMYLKGLRDGIELYAQNN